MSKSHTTFNRTREFISNWDLEEEHVALELTDAFDNGRMFVEQVLQITEEHEQYNVLVASYTNSFLLSNLLHGNRRKKMSGKGEAQN